jgi:hypothetical protein
MKPFAPVINILIFEFSNLFTVPFTIPYLTKHVCGMGRDYLSYDGAIFFSDGATTKCYEFIHGATI